MKGLNELNTRVPTPVRCLSTQPSSPALLRGRCGAPATSRPSRRARMEMVGLAVRLLFYNKRCKKN